MASYNHPDLRNAFVSEENFIEYVSIIKEDSKVENNARDSERTASDTNLNSLWRVEFYRQNFSNINEDFLPDIYHFGNFTYLETGAYESDTESVIDQDMGEIYSSQLNGNPEVLFDETQARGNGVVAELNGAGQTNHLLDN